MKLFNFTDLLAEIKIKIGIGQGWFHEIRNAVLIGASLKVLWDLSIVESTLLTIGMLGGFYIAGSVPILVNIYKRINELTTSKYNPHLNKIGKT